MSRAWIYLACVVAAVGGLHALRRVFWLFCLLVLPGTLAHESCHYLAGLLLRGGPVGFSLVPRREGRGWAMGAVTFQHIRWYNAFFIGIAPLALLPAAYALALWRVRGQGGLDGGEALILFLVANLVYAALPSWQDLRVAARSPIGWLLLAGGLLWAWLALQGGTWHLPFHGPRIGHASSERSLPAQAPVELQDRGAEAHPDPG